MGSRGRGSNDTVFGISTMPASTFPHFKKPMPPDQKSKLLAMHRAGRVNAGIYVAIVLAIYLILLTLLLCRYSRKHRSHSDGRHSACYCCGLEDDPQGPLAWILSLSSCFDKESRVKKSDGSNHSIEEHQPQKPETIELIGKTSTGISILSRQDTTEDEIRPVEV